MLVRATRAYAAVMTTLAWLLLVLAAAAALADWYAVARPGADRRLEYVAKPAVMVALIGVAATLTPQDATVRTFFVAALALSLLGDVALMLPRERFVAGLVAFLLAHLAYVGGLGVLALRAESIPGIVVGLVVVALVLGSVGRRVFGAVRVGQSGLLGPVAAYMGVISLMVVAACATGRPLAAAGAVLFYASDAMLAWDRFVGRRWGGLAVITTYHLGQALLVLSLAA
jgi:uncharacterized membrane protein YhhN